MAKPKTNIVIEEDALSYNLVGVWTPTPAEAKKPIEAIEGVISVTQAIASGRLNVWLNPCYDRNELIDEIREVVDGATN